MIVPMPVQRGFPAGTGGMGQGRCTPRDGFLSVTRLWGHIEGFEIVLV